MRQAVILKLGFVGALSFFIGGCAGSTRAPSSQTIPPSEAQKIPAPVDRYQLQSVRNGNLETTALLDRQTGYVWLLTKLTDAKPGEDDKVFVPAPVWGQGPRRPPSLTSKAGPCPPNDPLGAITLAACDPVLPKEGESK
jgi:hypothetical protein